MILGTCNAHSGQIQRPQAGWWLCGGGGGLRVRLPAPGFFRAGVLMAAPPSEGAGSLEPRSGMRTTAQ